MALLGTCAEGSPGNDPPGADPDRYDSPRVAIRSVPLRAAGAAAGAGLRRWGRARMTKSTFTAWLRARGRAAAGNEARGAGRGWGAGQGGEACLLACCNTLQGRAIRGSFTLPGGRSPANLPEGEHLKREKGS